MGRILVHMAVPNAKRLLAATMNGLSGNAIEHSVELLSDEGGASQAWDEAQGYSGTWWGASQALSPEIAQNMLASGYALETESWFAAFDEDSGTLVQNNTPDQPQDVSFAQFLFVCGLVRVELMQPGQGNE